MAKLRSKSVPILSLTQIVHCSGLFLKLFEKTMNGIKTIFESISTNPEISGPTILRSSRSLADAGRSTVIDGIECIPDVVDPGHRRSDKSKRG